MSLISAAERTGGTIPDVLEPLRAALNPVNPGAPPLFIIICQSKMIQNIFSLFINFNMTSTHDQNIGCAPNIYLLFFISFSLF